MTPFQSLTEWAKQLVMRQVAVDLATLEHEQNAELERQARALEAEGRAEQAAKLRSMMTGSLKQLEGPRRGRPRKTEGGES